MDNLYYDRIWAELPPSLQERTLDATRKILSLVSEGEKAIVRKQIVADPYGWVTPYHFWGGMAFRNALRDLGVTDDLFPLGNLDDYYATAIKLVLLDKTQEGRID